MHVREAELAALVLECESFVIETEQVQHGRVQVVDVDRVLDRAEAELVGLAVAGPALHPAAGEPDAEGVLVMIAARVSGLAVAIHALAQRGAAELRAPEDERIVEP